MSRSRDRSHCPVGKRNCRSGCSREYLNEIRDFRQSSQVEEYADVATHPCDSGACDECYPPPHR